MLFDVSKFLIIKLDSKSVRHRADRLVHFRYGNKVIATAGEVLPMDSRSERAMVSALVDGRRVVALQILFVGVETPKRPDRPGTCYVCTRETLCY